MYEKCLNEAFSETLLKKDANSNLIKDMVQNSGSESTQNKKMYKKLFLGFKKNKTDARIQPTETGVMSLNLKETFAQNVNQFTEERLIPDVVIIFKGNNNKSFTQKIDFQIGLLKTSFDCFLASDIKNSSYFLMLKLNKEDLERECSENNIKVKLMTSYEYQPYNPAKKSEFEPFRSRQRIEITQAALNNIIDVQQQKDLKVIQDVYQMHTVSGVERIREVWLSSKWYWPEPLSSFKDYILEGKHLNFSALSTLRIYFGEKVSYYFAWTCFYTCYLLVLAIPGLFITIFLTGDNYHTLLPLWAIYNSLCSTMVVEKWKRKSAELATRWGTLDMLNNKSLRRTLRKEYIGNEVINETTGELTRVNTKASTKIYFLLSTPVLILLVAGVVGTFVLTYRWQETRKSSYDSLVISIINGIIIAVLNFIYQKLVHYFVNKENHKYNESYERSFIIKAFLSLFFNSYLGIYYLIFVQNVELYKLSFNLVSILITKQATSLFMQWILPWVQYKFSTRKYFKELQKRGEDESKLNKHQKFSDLPPTSPENTDSVVQRPVLNCKKGTPETAQWDLTGVELNSMRIDNDDFNDDYGQVLHIYLIIL